MNDISALILQQTGINTNYFSPGSRYYGIAIGSLEPLHEGGLPRVYVRRRFIAQPERYHLLQEHSVLLNERPDTVTAQYLGDPEQFWRVCDANNVMQPDELTDTIGRRIKITLPEGIAGF